MAAAWERCEAGDADCPSALPRRLPRRLRHGAGSAGAGRHSHGDGRAGRATDSRRRCRSRALPAPKPSLPAPEAKRLQLRGRDRPGPRFVRFSLRRHRNVVADVPRELRARAPRSSDSLFSSRPPAGPRRRRLIRSTPCWRGRCRRRRSSKRPPISPRRARSSPRAGSVLPTASRSGSPAASAAGFRRRGRQRRPRRGRSAASRERRGSRCALVGARRVPKRCSRSRRATPLAWRSKRSTPKPGRRSGSEGLARDALVGDRSVARRGARPRARRGRCALRGRARGDRTPPGPARPALGVGPRIDAWGALRARVDLPAEPSELAEPEIKPPPGVRSCRPDRRSSLGRSRRVPRWPARP